MPITEIFLKNINMFLKATGDQNKAHYDDKYAIELGRKMDFELKGKVAPGMFTGPLVLYGAVSQGHIQNISGFKHFRFSWSRPIYPNDLLFTNITEKKDGLELKVSTPKKDVMKISCREKARHIEIPEDAEKRVYEKNIGRVETVEFLSSMGKSASDIIFNFLIPSAIPEKASKMLKTTPKKTVPDLFVSSLVPPSLLEWSGGAGFILMQEANIYDSAPIGSTITSTTYFKGEKETEKGFLYAGWHNCKSGNSLLQSGKVLCYTKNRITK